jgi:hypothetical protein
MATGSERETGLGSLAVRPARRFMYGVLVVILAAGLLSSCAFVPQMKREQLSDPAMMPTDDALETTLEGHSFPRREGAVGAGSGTGGGCGC